MSSRVAPSGKFSFKKVTKARLKGASLQLRDADGRYAGPIVLAGSGYKVATSFSGKLLSTKQKKLALGRISLKAGYAQLAKAATKSLGVAVAKATTKALRGKPVGAGQPNTPVGYSSGVSESSNDFRKPWAELLTPAGYTRMEKINSLGTVVAAIQPRVGSSQFRPGDVYEAVVTSDTREITRKTFTVAPYFVSAPALKSYNAGAGEVTVDYNSVSPTSGSVPGAAPGDPIVLPPSGQLTMTFWRPQRAAIRSDESGYLDWGNLNYGVTVGDVHATCAGLFTNVSSELVEDTTPFGEGDSIFFNRGSNSPPYRDSRGDRAAAVGNTLTLTLDVKTCATRAGGSGTGTTQVSLKARGEDVTGGQTTARQSFYVQLQ